MYLPPKKQDELLQQLKKKIAKWRNHWDSRLYKSQIPDYRRMANGLLPKELADKLEGKDYKYHSKLVPRVIPDGIAYLKSTLTNSLFNRDAIFEFVGRREEDYRRAQDGYALVSYEFDMTDTINTCERIIEDACEVGIGYGERVHFVDRILLPDYNDKNELRREHFEVVYEGPKLIYLKPELVYPDPQAEHISELTGYIKLMSVPISTIRSNAVDGGMYFDYAKNIKNIKAGDYDPTIKEEYAQQNDHKLDDNTNDDIDFRTFIAEFWLRMSGVENGFPCWYCVTIANYNTNAQLLRYDRDPMKTGTHPLIACQIFPKNGRFIGESVPEKVYPYMLEKFHKRNQRINLVNLAHDVAGMLFGAKGMFIDRNSILAKRGRILELGGSGKEVGNIPLDLSPLAHSVNEEMMIERDIESTLATNRVTMGQSANRRETATTTSIVDENSRIRANSPIRSVENTLIRPLAKGYLLHSQLLMPEEFKIRILGRNRGYEFRQLTRKDILGSFDVKCYGSSELLPRGIKQALMSKMVQSYVNNPHVRLDWPRIAAEEFKINEIPDAEHLVISPSYETELINRENAGFVDGMTAWPVIDTEDHDAHMGSHMETKEMMTQQGMPTEFIEIHMMNHQQRKDYINGQTNLSAGNQMALLSNRTDLNADLNSDMNPEVLGG